MCVKRKRRLSLVTLCIQQRVASKLVAFHFVQNVLWKALHGLSSKLSSHKLTNLEPSELLNELLNRFWVTEAHVLYNGLVLT